MPDLLWQVPLVIMALSVGFTLFAVWVVALASVATKISEIISKKLGL